MARRLAFVAENALVNGDLQRAQAALQELHDATARILAACPRLERPLPAHLHLEK